MIRDFLATPLGKFVRTLIAGTLASLFTLAINQLTTLPLDPIWIPVITSGLMTIEHFLRDAGWLAPDNVTKLVTTKVETTSVAPAVTVVSSPTPEVVAVKTETTTPSN